MKEVFVVVTESGAVAVYDNYKAAQDRKNFHGGEIHCKEVESELSGAEVFGTALGALFGALASR